MMRILLMLMAILGFSMLVLPATARPLTHDQVATTCGKHYGTSSGGHSGCVQECGKGVCMYDCKGKGKKEDCVGISFLTANPGGGTGSGDQPEAYLPPTPGVTLVMDFVNYGDLRFACSKVAGGLFAATGNKYACAHPDCDKVDGICMVYCIDGTCHAIMPGKPAGGLTLLAILQNGDSVNHITTASEPSATKDGGAAPPSTGGSPPPPPPPPIP
jgi:hypothetical protein